MNLDDYRTGATAWLTQALADAASQARDPDHYEELKQDVEKRLFALLLPARPEGHRHVG